jgi:protein-S-isoprenylcysteine O-methyltransferase
MHPYRIIVGMSWAVFVIYWTVSSFGVKRDLRRRSRWRAALMRIAVIIFIAAWLSHRSNTRQLHAYLWPLASSFPPSIVRLLGALICVFGIALAIWARAHLGRNWSPAPSLKEGHELVTSGPYQCIRHPIYAGMLAAALGSALVIIWWSITFLIMAIMFTWRVRIEEKLMMQQFPTQYPDYKKRSWALIPYLW